MKIISPEEREKLFGKDISKSIFIRNQDCDEEKTLEEFIVELNKLNQANLLCINGFMVNYRISEKYEKELIQVQDLINSFPFRKGIKITNSELITHPVPEEIINFFTTPPSS